LGDVATTGPYEVTRDTAYEKPIEQYAEPSMSCEPTARVGLEGIVVHGI